jgi:hypothetical protein
MDSTPYGMDCEDECQKKAYYAQPKWKIAILRFLDRLDEKPWPFGNY